MMAAWGALCLMTSVIHKPNKEAPAVF